MRRTPGPWRRLFRPGLREHPVLDPRQGPLDLLGAARGLEQLRGRRTAQDGVTHRHPRVGGQPAAFEDGEGLLDEGARRAGPTSAAR